MENHFVEDFKSLAVIAAWFVPNRYIHVNPLFRQNLTFKGSDEAEAGAMVVQAVRDTRQVRIMK